MSVDWQTASDRLNRFRTLDPSLRYDLTKLCMAASRDDKLAFKLEEGRTYGMRQLYCGKTEERPGADSKDHRHHGGALGVGVGVGAARFFYAIRK